MNSAFSPQALLAKSKVFIDRGLESRDRGDAGLFHMWSALSLELLGKFVLASIHPSLVADPSKFPSLLVACGVRDSHDVRSIAAKTVYERLRTLSADFDERAARFCMLMANRRNEELHSGSSPTTDLRPEAWIPEFWRIAQLLLGIASLKLDDWVGVEEAASARTLVQDSSKILEETVAARIRRASAEFEEQFPPGSGERTDVIRKAASLSWPGYVLQQKFDNWDSAGKHTCPACGCDAWLFGSELTRERLPYPPQDQPVWTEWEEVEYSTDHFGCASCDLIIRGRAELATTKVPSTFTLFEEADADWEPDYGND